MTTTQKQRCFYHSYEDFEYGFTFGTQFDQIKGKMLTSIELILNNQSTEDEACDGGLFSGPGGIAYMFIHLIRTPDVLTVSEKIKIIPMVQKFLNAQLLYCSKIRDLVAQNNAEESELSSRCGLLIGEAGTFAVGAVLAHFLGNDKLKEQCLREFVEAGEVARQFHDFDGKGSNDLFSGRAGYLCAALWLNQYLGYQPVPLETLFATWQAIVSSGRQQAKIKKIKHYPLSFSYCDEDFIGASHGASSILQVLLSWPQFLDRDKPAENDIRATVQYLFQILTEFQTGYFPATMREVSNLRKSKKRSDLTSDVNNDVHPLQWCHGMPGIAYLLAKVGIRYKNHEYLKFCLKIANSVWTYGLTTKGLGLCHGIAGNAYIFLLVYRLTEFDARFLYRAVRFAEFMFSPDCLANCEQSENPYSLFEGLAGTVCFLSDLLRPQQAEFPFFNVFYDQAELPVLSPLVVTMVPTPELTVATGSQPVSVSFSKEDAEVIPAKDPSLPVSILVPTHMKKSKAGNSSRSQTAKTKRRRRRKKSENNIVLIPDRIIKVEAGGGDGEGEMYEGTDFDEDHGVNIDQMLEVDFHVNEMGKIKIERISPVEEILS